MLHRRRGDDGNMVILLSVIFVAGALIVMLLDVVHGGLRSSRRAGDSANSLQVADAGVNDAVTSVGDQPSGLPVGTSFTRSGGIGDGTYTYTATLDQYQITATHTAPIWHIDARGRDGQGVERRVRADAVPESVFSQAIFVKGAGVFGTGLAVDSYVSGTSLANTCNGLGTVGSNNANQLTFGGPGNPNNNSHNNCPWKPSGGSWPVDACIAYYAPEDLTAGSYPPYTGQTGHCPTIRTAPGTYPGTWKTAPLFDAGTVTGPGGTPAAALDCDDATTLVAGQIYYVTSLELDDGCRVSGGDPTRPIVADLSAPQPGAVRIFVTGSVEIGSGANDMINEPPHSHPSVTGPCGATGALTNGIAWGNAQNAMAPSWFCPGWPRTLQIYKIGGNGNVRFNGNGMKVWTTIAAPEAPAAFSAPQMHVWGALIASSSSGASQQSPQWGWHYDESLDAVLTGRYRLANWRECPITSTTTC